MTFSALLSEWPKGPPTHRRDRRGNRIALGSTARDVVAVALWEPTPHGDMGPATWEDAGRVLRALTAAGFRVKPDPTRP